MLGLNGQPDRSDMMGLGRSVRVTGLRLRILMGLAVYVIGHKFVVRQALKLVREINS